MNNDTPDKLYPYLEKDNKGDIEINGSKYVKKYYYEDNDFPLLGCLSILFILFFLLSLPIIAFLFYCLILWEFPSWEVILILLTFPGLALLFGLIIFPKNNN